MKAEGHPKYNHVIFVDNDWELASRSTMTSNEKRTVNGVEHYVIRVSVSSYTHPFWTGGQQRFVDTAGRLERFQRRYQRGK